MNYYTVQWRLPLLVDRLRIASQAHVTPLHHLNPGHVTRVTSHQAGTGIIRSGRDTITFCVRAATLRLSRRQFFSTDDTRQRTLAGERTELTLVYRLYVFSLTQQSVAILLFSLLTTASQVLTRYSNVCTTNFRDRPRGDEDEPLIAPFTLCEI